jgi:predicted transposase/invertase (TIGR01784 family)
MPNHNAKPIFIDPLVDFAFKKIFGSEPNKDLLIAFLNEVLHDENKQIVDLVYNKNEHPGNNASQRGVIFDLLCTTDKGEQFLIEVQRGKQDTFKQRALFYASRLISDQAPKGNLKSWNYRIQSVYLIALLDGFILHPTPADGFIQDVCLCNRSTGEIFYDKLHFKYIELLKFDKQEEELATDLDKWLYFIKNMSRMVELPSHLNKPIFEKLFKVAAYSNLTKEEQNMWDAADKIRWDHQAVLDTAIRDAERQVLEEGIVRERKNTAIRLLKTNMPLKEIGKITTLSIKAIRALKDSVDLSPYD